MPGMAANAAAAKPLNNAARENPSTRAFSLLDFIFSSPLTHDDVCCSIVPSASPHKPDK
jgi:hypothetical protein